MVLSQFTQFKGVTEIGDTLLSEQIESNLKTFLDWAFLGIGAFFNVTIPTSGAYGGTFDRLRPVDNPAYGDAQVWQGARKDWVWETGVERVQQPLQVTGVYVEGTFYPTATTSGTYAHHINHPWGAVVFDSAVVTTALVQAEYSYRYVHVTTSDAEWFKDIHYDSFRVDDTHFTQFGSGIWDMANDNRIQLPAVVIEAVPRRSFSGFELGAGTQLVHTDILFHIFTEDRWARNNIMDILSFQNDKTIFLYDVNAIAAISGFPLDENGSLVTNPKMYVDLVSHTNDGGYRWRRCRFTNTTAQSMGNLTPSLFGGIVRTTLEIVTPDLGGS